MTQFRRLAPTTSSVAAAHLSGPESEGSCLPQVYSNFYLAVKCDAGEINLRDWELEDSAMHFCEVIFSLTQEKGDPYILAWPLDMKGRRHQSRHPALTPSFAGLQQAEATTRAPL
jgi:hypothetical protein